MVPCIRGLKCFDKKGCPEKTWNGKDGCQAWIEMSITDPDNPMKQKIEKKCLDLWSFTFQWANLGLLEGNQKATESFRNAMCESDPDNPGKDRPKPDIASVELVRLIMDQKKQIEK